MRAEERNQMARLKLCRWKCGNKTERRCGICLACCNRRDETNRQIDAGLIAYVPPQDRPGHRFFEKKKLVRSPAQVESGRRLGQARKDATLGKDRMPQERRVRLGDS